MTRGPDRAPTVLSDGDSVLTRLDRISQRAKADHEGVFNNLFSLLTHELLWYAFRRLKRGKSPGVDNVTVEEYEADLEANLRGLLTRLHRGSYRPQPSLRKNIPKGFFDNVSHQHLEELLRRRISDPKLLRLIVRFLKAGVMIEGRLQATEDGVPQGASLSPLLANVYLHYVLDEWFEREVKPRLRGEAEIIRFADDFVCCFELASDAMRYQAVLPKRLGRYSLSVAEEKTKLIRFGRFASRDHQRRGEGAPSTFDFLGFTHYCGQSRAGKFKLKRRTSGKKLRVKLMEMRLWFHHQLSTPVGEMWQTLNMKLRGHYQYYGINDNWPMLMAYRSKVRRMAKRHLSRRSQNSYVNWDDFNRFTELHPLASPTKLTDLIALNREMLSARAK